jgi:peptide/nickel transport system substrate-binding protein
MYKKVYSLLLVLLFLTGMLPLIISPAVSQAVEPGPPAETIYVDVRLSQDVGLGDVAAGRTDLFLWGVSPATLQRLSPQVVKNLKLAEARSAFWSFVFNPVESPELGPGVVNTTAGEVHFNPFAIREVRFAMNFVLNRKALIDDILLGGGEPMFSPVIPANPMITMIQDIINEFGFTPEGDLEKGKQMVDAALTRIAAELEGTGYTLEKVSDPAAPAGFWWKFSGPGVPGGEEIVSVKFVIRIEDERHEGGLAFANWIEETGIKVERLEWDRRRAIRTVYLTNPRDYLWNIYTEGWISMSDYPYVEFDFSFFYSPLHGFVPAYPIEAWLVYRNATIEELADIIETGAIPNPDEYVRIMREIYTLGASESVRIFAVNTIEYWAYSTRVTNLVTGFVTGPATIWPYRTMDTPDHTVRLTEFSASGALFLTVWNPVLGFTGYYAEIIRMGIRDYGGFTHPATGEPIPIRSDWTVEKNFEVNETTLELIPQLDVPADAMVFDPVAEEWVPIGPGKKAIVAVTYDYKFSNFHHGVPMTMADVMNALGFTYEWASEDFPGDPFYDSSFASDVAPFLATIVGVKVLDEDTLVVYGNYYHPYSDNVIAWYFSLFPDLPWEVYAAMEYVVLEGGPESGVTYYWETIEGAEGLDLITKSHADDMAAALRILKDQGWTVTVGEQVVREVPGPYIPPYAADWISTDEALSRYDAAVDFETRFGHMYISNGPFWLKSYKPEERFMELKAFRDPTYPFDKTYWQKQLVVASMRIDDILLPAEREQGQSFAVDVFVSYTQTYPEVIDEPATKGDVTVFLLSPEGKVMFQGKAEFVEAGHFRFVVPDYITLDLAPGIYTIKVVASIGGLWGVSGQKEIVITESTTRVVEERTRELANNLRQLSESLAQAFENLAASIDDLSSALGNMGSTLQSSVSDVKGSVDDVGASIDALAGQLTTLTIMVAVAIILSLIGIVIPFVKK